MRESEQPRVTVKASGTEEKVSIEVVNMADNVCRLSVIWLPYLDW